MFEVFILDYECGEKCINFQTFFFFFEKLYEKRISFLGTKKLMSYFIN